MNPCTREVQQTGHKCHAVILSLEQQTPERRNNGRAGVVKSCGQWELIKSKQIVTNMFVSVQQQYLPQK